MGEVVNLRKARRARARAGAETKAVENRAKFGRPKHERAASELHEKQRLARLDLHRRETPPDDAG